jgi:homoserine dehydrogenase
MLCLLVAATTSALQHPQGHSSRRTALGLASVVVTGPALPSFAASPHLTGPRVATQRKVPFVLIGAGGVGSALLKTITDSRVFHADRYGIRFSALAVCDSSAAVLATAAGSELSDKTLTALAAHKAAGSKLATLRGVSVQSPRDQPDEAFLLSLVEKYAAEAPEAIIIDCSASGATVPALLLAARRLRVVSANKKPFADSSIDSFLSLARSPSSTGRVRYEATVGAGLPVVATPLPGP